MTTLDTHIGNKAELIDKPDDNTEVEDFLYFSSIINAARECNQEIRKRLRFGKAAIRGVKYPQVKGCVTSSEGQDLSFCGFPIILSFAYLLSQCMKAGQ